MPYVKPNPSNERRGGYQFWQPTASLYDSTVLQPIGEEKVISLDRKIPLSVTFIPTNGTGGGYQFG
jgi:hypothetical protein